jgi:hypothetical protein
MKLALLWIIHKKEKLCSSTQTGISGQSYHPQAEDFSRYELKAVGFCKLIFDN